MMKHELAAALSALMQASEKLDGLELEPVQRNAYLAAREQAAKVLLKNRATSGRPWITSPNLDSYLERWRALRAASSAISIERVEGA